MISQYLNSLARCRSASSLDCPVLDHEHVFQCDIDDPMARQTCILNSLPSVGDTLETWKARER